MSDLVVNEWISSQEIYCRIKSLKPHWNNVKENKVHGINAGDKSTETSVGAIFLLKGQMPPHEQQELHVLLNEAHGMSTRVESKLTVL